MCAKLRHIYYTDVASGACECSTPSDATCWGSTPNPLEHDSHAAVRVCFVNIAQNSRALCLRSMGLGCCPTSRSLDLAIQRHCLPRHILCFHRRMHCLASEDYGIFKSALPCTGWTVLLNSLSQMGIFQFSHPGGGRRGLCWRTGASNFNPPSRMGWNAAAADLLSCAQLFQSTTPSGVGPNVLVLSFVSINFNPPAPSGVGPKGSAWLLMIS